MTRCRVRADAAERYVSLLRRCVRAAVKAERLPYPCRADIFLISDGDIRAVNKARRDIDKVTDVLSFPVWNPGETPVPDPDDGRVFLGDILIAYNRAMTQARRRGHSFERELCLLAAHGTLHLMGYDHGSEEDAAVMRAKEEAAADRRGICE